MHPALLINRAEVIGQRGHDLVLPGEQPGITAGPGASHLEGCQEASRKDQLSVTQRQELWARRGQFALGSCLWNKKAFDGNTERQGHSSEEVLKILSIQCKWPKFLIGKLYFLHPLSTFCNVVYI